MPIVRISCFDIWSVSDKQEISRYIHDALVEAFKIPEHDFNHRIDTYKSGEWQVPPDRTNKYVLIEMTVYPGRSKQAKGNLYRSIAEKMSRMGIRGSDCTIVLYEPPLENWGSKGIRGDEENIGFDLNV